MGNPADAIIPEVEVGIPEEIGFPGRFGALPPPDAMYQIGDRSDKDCMLAALEVLQNNELTYATVCVAIDAYLEQCKKHGWVLGAPQPLFDIDK